MFLFDVIFSNSGCFPSAISISLAVAILFLSQEPHQLLSMQDLTDFLDHKKGFIYAKSGGISAGWNTISWKKVLITVAQVWGRTAI